MLWNKPTRRRGRRRERSWLGMCWRTDRATYYVGKEEGRKADKDKEFWEVQWGELKSSCSKYIAKMTMDRWSLHEPRSNPRIRVAFITSCLLCFWFPTSGLDQKVASAEHDKGQTPHSLGTSNGDIKTCLQWIFCGGERACIWEKECSHGTLLARESLVRTREMQCDFTDIAGPTTFTAWPRRRTFSGVLQHGHADDLYSVDWSHRWISLELVHKYFKFAGTQLFCFGRYFKIHYLAPRSQVCANRKWEVATCKWW